MNTKNEVKLQQEYIEKVKKINQNKNLKYNILTFGCQLNENDSEKLCGMLEEMGYTKTAKPEEVILHTNIVCIWFPFFHPVMRAPSPTEYILFLTSDAV